MPLDSSPASAPDERLLLCLVLGGALWALLPGQESPDPTPRSTPSPLVSEAVPRGLGCSQRQLSLCVGGGGGPAGTGIH